MSSKESTDPWHTITLEELAKHVDFDKNDAWMAIRGIVYDVTSYAAKHPGGASKVRNFAGKDATEIFDMIHAYVDPASILRGYQVAVLKGGPRQGLCSKFQDGLLCFGGKYSKPPSTSFKQDSIIGTYIVEFFHDSHEDDWTVGITQKRFLHVFKCLGTKKAWLSVYELPEPLECDQLIMSFRNKYKHIEITLRKPSPTSMWAQQLHGIKQSGKFVLVTEGHSKFDAYIIYKKCLTTNILMFGIQIVSSARMGIPLGFHVELHHKGINRPYTPVCFSLMDKSTVLHSAHAREKKQMEDVPSTVLYFMIKIYPNGAFTQALDKIPPDDGRELPTLQVSTPHGYFNPQFLSEFTALFLIAAGTGITPITRILQQTWHMSEKLRGKRIVFWHFAQKEHDLVWKKYFAELEEATSWFHYFPVLTQATAECNWQGLKGRISPELITTSIAGLGLEKKGSRKACSCGPTGFNSSTVSALSGEVLPENIFVFSN